MQQLVIIGSGPAGLTAAIYAARANLSPLVIEGWQSGGQLTTTTEVENYPGFATPIMGPDLMKAMRAQAVRVGTTFLTGDVSSVNLQRQPFALQIDGADRPLHTRALIIATGASALHLGVPGEQRLTGHGVSTCATCDGFFYKNQPIVVVGGGDSALEEALFLTKFASSVTVIHRRDSLRASKIMQERARQHPKMTFLWNSAVQEVLGDSLVTGLRLRHVLTGASSEIACAGVFVAIGHKPNTDLFKGQLAMDTHGYLLLTDGAATSVPGVFAAGDVHDSRYRQAVTAAGAGCRAALDAERYLDSHP